jgi:hypothetical protein
MTRIKSDVGVAAKRKEKTGCPANCATKNMELHPTNTQVHTSIKASYIHQQEEIRR